MKYGWPSITASASMPPTPQPTHAEAVDHRGVRVGADQGVGIGRELAVLLAQLHAGRQVFEVDLVDDAGAGRHHAEVLEGALGELEQLVALDVPLEFHGHVVA